MQCTKWITRLGSMLQHGLWKGRVTGATGEEAQIGTSPIICHTDRVNY